MHKYVQRHVEVGTFPLAVENGMMGKLSLLSSLGSLVLPRELSTAKLLQMILHSLHTRSRSHAHATYYTWCKCLVAGRGGLLQLLRYAGQTRHVRGYGQRLCGQTQPGNGSLWSHVQGLTITKQQRCCINVLVSVCGQTVCFLIQVRDLYLVKAVRVRVT
jgi:hypothetical protein